MNFYGTDRSRLESMDLPNFVHTVFCAVVFYTASTMMNNYLQLEHKTRLLWEVKEGIADYLTEIYESSLNTSEVLEGG